MTETFHFFHTNPQHPPAGAVVERGRREHGQENGVDGPADNEQTRVYNATARAAAAAAAAGGATGDATTGIAGAAKLVGKFSTLSAMSYTAPQFSEKEMRKEKTSLSAAERETLVQVDFHGSLCAPYIRETASVLESSLLKMMQFVRERIPDEQKQAYLEAMSVAVEAQQQHHQNHDSTSHLSKTTNIMFPMSQEAHPFQFLRCENFNCEAAARRYVKYWEMRKRLFGESKHEQRRRETQEQHEQQQRAKNEGESPASTSDQGSSLSTGQQLQPNGASEGEGRANFAWTNFRLTDDEDDGEEERKWLDPCVERISDPVDGSQASLSEMLGNGIFWVLPTDRMGRRAIYMDEARVQSTTSDRFVGLRCLFHLLTILVQDEIVQKHGYVFIMDTCNMKLEDFDRKKTRVFFELIRDAFPCRLRAFHILFPCTGKSVARLFSPTMLYLMGKELRMRTAMHAGSPKELSMDLQEYGFQPEGLPDILLGTYTLEHFLKWFHDVTATKPNEHHK